MKKFLLLALFAGLLFAGNADARRIRRPRPRPRPAVVVTPVAPAVLIVR